MAYYDRFSPLMAEVLHFTGTPEGLSLPLAEAEAKLVSLAEAERVLSRDEIQEKREKTGNMNLDMVKHSTFNDAEYSRFAVYAWADENMLNAPRCDASSWASLSLQRRYFDTAGAGRLFFEKLDEILNILGVQGNNVGLYDDLSSRIDIAATISSGREGMNALKTYALCLLYGFRGIFYSRPDELAQIRRACRILLSENQTQQLPSPVAMQKSDTAAKKSSVRSLAVFILVPLVVTTLFYLFCANILSSVSLPEFQLP